MNNVPRPPEPEEDPPDIDYMIEVTKQEAPQDFVVVFAYTSPDGELEEEFGKLINDVKALYTFKNDLRVYAVIEESARNVLAVLEKPKDG